MVNIFQSTVLYSFNLSINYKSKLKIFSDQQGCRTTEDFPLVWSFRKLLDHILQQNKGKNQEETMEFWKRCINPRKRQRKKSWKSAVHRLERKQCRWEHKAEGFKEQVLEEEMQGRGQGWVEGAFSRIDGKVGDLKKMKL